MFISGLVLHIYARSKILSENCRKTNQIHLKSVAALALRMRGSVAAISFPFSVSMQDKNLVNSPFS